VQASKTLAQGCCCIEYFVVHRLASGTSTGFFPQPLWYVSTAGKTIATR